MNISLTPKLEKMVRGKVESGYYSNASEVVREALRLMETHEILIEQTKLEKLRAHLAEGMEQIAKGEFTTVTTPRELDDMFKEIQTGSKG